MCPIFGTKYLRMDQVKFAKDSLQKILLGPFLNTFSHLFSGYREGKANPVFRKNPPPISSNSCKKWTKKHHSNTIYGKLEICHSHWYKTQSPLQWNHGSIYIEKKICNTNILINRTNFSLKKYKMLKFMKRFIRMNYFVNFKRAFYPWFSWRTMLIVVAATLASVWRELVC